MTESAKRDCVSPADRALLRQMSAGMTNGAIAKVLDISDHIVNYRIRKIYVLLGARDRANCVAIAYAIGILKGMP